MPYIRQLCLVVFGLSLLVSACTRQAKVPVKKESGGPIDVRLALVRSKQVQRVVESVGTFYPYDEVLVSAEIEGKVEQVNVDLGDTVAAGQVLVRVSDEEQRYLLLQNEAQMRQSLERLGLKEENERVGERRRSGMNGSNRWWSRGSGRRRSWMRQQRGIRRRRPAMT